MCRSLNLDFRKSGVVTSLARIFSNTRGFLFRFDSIVVKVLPLDSTRNNFVSYFGFSAEQCDRARSFYADHVIFLKPILFVPTRC